MRVEWSYLARDDLDDLVRYISRDSAFYARRFGQKLESNRDVILPVMHGTGIRVPGTIRRCPGQST